MNERKLKLAFSKIKFDVENLNDDVAKVRMQVAQISRDGVSNGDRSREIICSEFGELKKLIEKLSLEVAENSKMILKNNEDIKLLNSQSSEDVRREDILLINEKLASFQEMVNDKLVAEISEVRAEMTAEIAKVFDNMVKGLEKIERIGSKEVKGGKVEKVKAEKIDLKRESSTEKKEFVKEGVEYVEVDEDKKEGRIKKIIRWLFVDDEDGVELDELKRAVEKEEKKSEVKKK